MPRRRHGGRPHELLHAQHPEEPGAIAELVEDGRARARRRSRDGRQTTYRHRDAATAPQGRRHRAAHAVRQPRVAPRARRSSCSTSTTASRSTRPRRSACTGTTCCRSCTATRSSARVDVKADRKAKTLVVPGAFAEPGVDIGEVAEALAGELRAHGRVARPRAGHRRSQGRPLQSRATGAQYALSGTQLTIRSTICSRIARDVARFTRTNPSPTVAERSAPVGKATWPCVEEELCRGRTRGRGRRASSHARYVASGAAVADGREALGDRGREPSPVAVEVAHRAGNPLVALRSRRLGSRRGRTARRPWSCGLNAQRVAVEQRLAAAVADSALRSREVERLRSETSA